MVRYFFDIVSRQGAYADPYGDDLTDLNEAKDQAQALLLECMGKEVPGGGVHSVSCDVRDDGGRVVYKAILELRTEQEGRP